jgi:hypothetical protein
MKTSFYATIVSLFIIFSNSYSQKDNDFLINNKGIGVFKLNNTLKQIRLPKYESLIDTTMYYDDGSSLKGNYLKIDKENFILVLTWKDSICEAQTNIKKYSTIEGIRIGLSFEEVFNIIKSHYSIEDDFGELMLFDKKNHLRIWFTNSNNSYFDFDEINNLYKNNLTIEKTKLSKMKVRQIDLINLVD